MRIHTNVITNEDDITEYEIAHDSEREVTETEGAIPDLPPGDDGKPTEHPDPAAPGADDI